jgi:hypothetical protein
LPPAIGSARDDQDGRIQCSSTRRHADQRQSRDDRLFEFEAAPKQFLIVK